MNFFAQQDHARRQTRKLVFLFALAVVAIVAAVNLALALIWSWTEAGYVFGIRSYPRGFFATNTGITLALIGGGTLIEMLNLRGGGDAVARMAGGRLVPPVSGDAQERRLLNVVEEMAIAAGIAVPKVYLLEREQAINAFAAGYNQDEAVVAVTRGALERLTRDELQGVVGHEFSHILNGDMRLNIRLIGLLYGIQMIAGFGHHLIDYGSHSWSGRVRQRKGPSLRVLLLLSGIAMLAVGSIGVFFGRLIKAAVSRQREYLADASAIQFTRNADGLGCALRKIAGLSRSIHPGSRIDHPNAEQLSHLFLGAPRPGLVSGLLATHPPIEERLRRIYGRSVALHDAPVLPAAMPATQPDLPDIPYQASGFAAGEVAVAEPAATAAVAPARLDAELDAALRDTQGACALVYALLLADGSERAAQLVVLPQEQGPFVAFLAGRIKRLPRSARLPLLDLAMPALRQLSEEQRKTLLANVERMIAADRRLTLAEFVLQTVLARRLSAQAGRATPVRHAGLDTIREDCAVLLSLAAHVATPESGCDADMLFAAGAARCMQAGLSSTDLIPTGALAFPRVRLALERAHALAPLAKPVLIKSLMAASAGNEQLSLASADLLRAVCAALEAPVPEAVAATYPHFHW